MQRKLLYGIGGLISLLIVAIIANSISHIGKVGVTLRAIPGDSVLYIDNVEVSSGKHYLKAGKHSFIAKRAGFTADAQTKTITKKVTITLLPDPTSAEAQAYLEKNTAIQLQRESIIGAQVTQNGAAAVAATPIINLLPYTDVEGPFTVDYGPSDTRKGGTVIYIKDSSPDGRTNALKWIKQQGYTVADFEIVFSDFNNPIVTTTPGAE